MQKSRTEKAKDEGSRGGGWGRARSGSAESPASTRFRRLPRPSFRWVASSLLAGLLTLFLPGCGDLLGPTEPTGVAVQVDAGGVTLQNETDEPFGYFVHGFGDTVVIPWSRCSGPACPTLAPGGSVRLESSEIPGWGQSRQLAVNWWTRTIRSDGSVRMGPIQQRIVDY